MREAADDSEEPAVLQRQSGPAHPGADEKPAGR